MTRKKTVEKLTGQALLQRVKALENSTKEEKAEACGYYTITKQGKKRLNMMAFMTALIDAEGIELESKQTSNGRGGRSAGYRLTVQSNGNLLIGSTYTQQMGLQPGDVFEISLGRKHIHLKQLTDA